MTAIMQFPGVMGLPKVAVSVPVVPLVNCALLEVFWTSEIATGYRLLAATVAVPVIAMRSL